MKIRNQVRKSCEMGFFFPHCKALGLRVRKELFHFAPTGYCTVHTPVEVAQARGRIVDSNFLEPRHLQMHIEITGGSESQLLHKIVSKNLCKVRLF